ncbi:major facilitator superfamily protein [Helicobacter muridarum]|uniref:Major facilitator superfamily protein n=1 Tax=Helicobacter muridarum TaxID=216 RepID=A0A377PX65_9HELI|nr:major facilitator superfamily protein [Helicobacter muridarum]
MLTLYTIVILSSYSTHFANNSNSLAKQKITFNISIYIASTIAGGLIGRIGGAYLTQIFSWQISFIILGISLILGALIVFTCINSIPSRISKINLSEMISFLSNKTSLIILDSVFVVFFWISSCIKYVTTSN